MKVKRLKTIKELEATIPTKKQIKNYNLFCNKLKQEDFTYKL